MTLQEKFKELVQSQKWDCYRMDPAGFVREAGWPMMRWDVKELYSSAALAAALAENQARNDALYDLAVAHPQMGEDEYVALTVRLGFYR